MEEKTPRLRVRFGIFEADLGAEELRRSGIRIKIQNQPFKVLSCLLERPGEIVTREQLQQRLWGSETTVDFDHSLGTAINKLREALRDSADNPRFIETLARRGYRFIAPVSSAPSGPASQESAGELLTMPPVAGPLSVPPSPAPVPPGPIPRSQKYMVGLLIACLCALALLTVFAALSLRNDGLRTPFRISQVTYSGRVFPGEPLQESLGTTATDGSRIYFLQIENGRAALAQALIADGETSILNVPSEISAPELGNISPDGSELVVRNDLIPKAEQPLWIVPTLGGTARNLSNILGHDATWMPDGRRILYAAGSHLYIANQDGSGSTPFATLPGRAFWLRWSPEGDRLRFTLVNSLNHTTSLWEVSSNGKNLRPVLGSWSGMASECCGSWTPDGKYFVFQSAHNGRNNIWELRERSFLNAWLKPKPVQITNGPLSYQAPITASAGHRLFFVGLDTRSVLLRYEAGNRQFVPYGKSLNAAELVDYSRDGKWVAWINPEDSTLWRSRIDGTQRVQLTTHPLEVFMMHWSPGGHRIVLMGREPGKLWRIYVVDADAGNLVPLLDEARNEADPDWSPDGKSLIFGRLPESMAEKSLPKAIYILNVATRKTVPLPQSEGMFSPRWSPDGRYIAAMPLDQSRLMLFDTGLKTWKTLVALPAHDPVWSHDGRFVYFHDFAAEDQPIYRVSVPDGHLDRISGLKSVQPLDVLDFRFAGLTPQDVPLVSARISTANIYSMDLDSR